MSTTLTEDMQALLQRLNAADVAEAGWYDRNHKAYELVCYVNNIAGLYLAGNHQEIPVLVDRAHGYLNRDDAARLNPEYRDHVMRFLRTVSQAMAADKELPARQKRLLPKALLA